MAQNAQAATIARAAAGNTQSQPLTDAAHALTVGKGTANSLNNTAGAAKIVSASARRICKVIVNTAPTAVSGVYDAATAGACTAANLVFNIPEAVGVYDVDIPLANGLGLVVGTAGVIALSYQ